MNLEYIILISITIVLVLITAWQFSRIRVLMKSLSSLKLELIQSTDIIKKLYAKDYAKRHQWTDEEIKKSKEEATAKEFSFNEINMPEEIEIPESPDFEMPEIPLAPFLPEFNELAGHPVAYACYKQKFYEYYKRVEEYQSKIVDMLRNAGVMRDDFNAVAETYKAQVVDDMVKKATYERDVVSKLAPCPHCGGKVGHF